MRRVIIADDEPITRMDLSDMLTELGFQVVGEAADGFDAIELCRSLQPDVVLMDVKMPIFDGLSAAETILSEELAGCVVLLTAFSDRELVRRAGEAGVTGYLVKPVDAGQLRTVLERYLKKTARKKPWKSGSAEIMSDFPRSPSSIWKARATARTSTRPAACFIPACPQACWSRSWERIF